MRAQTDSALDMASFEQAFRILTARMQEKDHEHEEGRKSAAHLIEKHHHDEIQRASVNVITTGSCPPVDLNNLNPLQLLQRFQKLQAERVAIYNEFDEYVLGNLHVLTSSAISNCTWRMAM